jgi:hypothetical protein
MKVSAQYAEEHLIGIAEPERQAAIDEVVKLYRTPKDASVAAFLQEHGTIPELLLQAAPKLKKYFGDATLMLRAPVDEDGSQTLYAVVLWPGEVSEVRHALDKFDDNWWLANSGHDDAGSLSFTYELV